LRRIKKEAEKAKMQEAILKKEEAEKLKEEKTTRVESYEA